MAIKRYTGSNIREVMMAVRNELGDDAVIISNRKVSGGIEIVATSDDELQKITRETNNKPEPERKPPQPELNPQPAAQVAKEPIAHPTFQDALMMREKLPNPFNIEDEPEPERPFPLVTQRRKTTGGMAYAAQAFVEQPEKDDSSSLKSDVKVKLASQPSGAKPRLSITEPAPKQSAPEVPEELEVVEAELVDEVEDQGPVLPTAAERFEEDLKKSRAITQWSTQMLGDLNSMQDLIRRQILPRVSQSIVYSEIHQRLVQAGLQKDFCTQMLSSLPGELAERRMDRVGMSHWVEHAMVEQISVINSPEAWWGCRAVIALIGANGSGKTTALVKMVARFLMDNDPNEAVIVSIDSDKHETLKGQAEILGVDFVLVEDYQDLDEVLKNLSYKRLVMIDTVGYSYRHKRLKPQMERLSNLKQPIKAMLVLNASSEAESLEVMTASYLKTAHEVNLNLDDCIVCKLDEAIRIGALLSTMARHNLRLNYQSSGSDVLEDFERGSALALVRQALSVIQVDDDFSSLDTSKDMGFQFDAMRNALLDNLNEMTTVLASIRREFKNAGFVEATRSIPGLDASRKAQPYARLVDENKGKELASDNKKPELLWGVNDYAIETAYFNLSKAPIFAATTPSIISEISSQADTAVEEDKVIAPKPEPIKIIPVRMNKERLKRVSKK